MKLYHGSNMRVEKPDLQRSKPFKDFGQGFYLSDNYKQAEDLAIVKVEQMRSGEAVVNEFDFDESVLSSGELSVKVFDDYSEEWAEFVLTNRNNKISQPSHTYDIDMDQLPTMVSTISCAVILVVSFRFSDL